MMGSEITRVCDNRADFTVNGRTVCSAHLGPIGRVLHWRGVDVLITQLGRRTRRACKWSW